MTYNNHYNEPFLITFRRQELRKRRASEMPVEMPPGLPFAVDTWTPASSLKRHRFLTHAHRDHLAGIATASASSPIYASRFTILITLRIFPQLDRAAFVELNVGDPPLHVLDPDGDFTVTALDANHCPGAVMFLFEGPFGVVLHTGDCRLTSDCLSALTPPYLTRHIHYLFLDCTFTRCAVRFPTKEDSIRQVINCIWKHPSAPVVYLVCDMLGHEDVLIAVSRAFGSKIYVNRERNFDCHQTLIHVAPEILATDDAAASTRFHVIPFPKLSERAMEILTLARAAHQPEPLIIRPSAQWYNHYDPSPPEEAASMQQQQQEQKPVLTEAMRDEFGVWHVCLSLHSSRDELEQALGILKPKWVVSTTPPFMAMDLSYVRKHCSLSQFGPEDPLWKLLGISDGMSAVIGSPQVVLMAAGSAKKSDEVFSSCVDECGSDSQAVEEVAPAAVVDCEIRVEPPVTLFGSARFGLPQHEPELWNYEYESVEIIGDVELESNHSATEPEFCSNSKPIEVVQLIEAATKEHNSVSEIELTESATKQQSLDSESELFKDSKSDGVEVDDLTKDGRKEQNLSAKTESEHCKYDKGNGEAKLGAQEHNLNVHAGVMEVCRHKVTGEGKGRMEESISAVHVRVSATEDDTIITSSEIEKNSDHYSEMASDSSTVVGSSKGLNVNLRRLYRSMNVPVPRPLPSLVALMAASKRPRVSETVQL